MGQEHKTNLALAESMDASSFGGFPFAGPALSGGHLGKQEGWSCCAGPTCSQMCEACARQRGTYSPRKVMLKATSLGTVSQCSLTGG